MRVQQSKCWKRAEKVSITAFVSRQDLPQPLSVSVSAYLWVCVTWQNLSIITKSRQASPLLPKLCKTQEKSKPLYPSSSPSPPLCPSTPPPPLSLHLLFLCLSLIHAFLPSSFLFCLATHTRSLGLIHLISSQVSFAHTLHSFLTPQPPLLNPSPFYLYSQLFNYPVPL